MTQALQYVKNTFLKHLNPTGNELSFRNSLNFITSFSEVKALRSWLVSPSASPLKETRKLLSMSDSQASIFRDRGMSK